MPKIRQDKIQSNGTKLNFSPIFSEELGLVSGSGTTFTITGTTVDVVPSMNYYASASDVAGLCRNLLGPEANFSTSTSPNETAVNLWLSSGCSIIESRLGVEGYLVPIAETAVLFSWLRDLNTLYAAARAEMSRTTFTLAPGERTRGQVFEDLFWKQLDKLCNMDLTTVGATRSSNSIQSMTLFVGGTGKTQKDTNKADSNRVAPRFSKGMFDMPGIITDIETGAT